jgi:hypothetical protein
VDYQDKDPGQTYPASVSNGPRASEKNEEKDPLKTFKMRATPKPWRRINDLHPTVIGYKRGCHYDPVCRILPEGLLPEGTLKDRRDANEWLITKAPDLCEFVELIARMKTSMEYEREMPPDEDWVCKLNELIKYARKLTEGDN